MRMILKLVYVAGAVYIGISLALYFFQSRLIYFPSRDLASTPESVGLKFEDVYLDAAGTRIHAWYIPAEGARLTLLFCHGNAGNISHRLESISIFHELGLNVIIFDYAGFGMSDGKPAEEQTYADARAAWKHLVETRGVDPQNIVVFGRSLGGAVATRLTSQETTGALILESTFTSVPDMAANLYPILPVRWLARIRYDSTALITDIKVPLLSIHSRDDELIPFEQGRRLFETAPEPKTFVEIAGSHNNGFLRSAPTYITALQEFLEPLGPR